MTPPPPLAPLPDVPVQHVDAAGTRFAYRAWGEGPPLFLLHGGPGASGAYWPGAVRWLGDSYACIALDLRGHGLSARDGPYGIRRFAEDVIAVADALGHRAFALMGHSYGALVGLEAAARAGDACRTLVAVGAFGSTPRMIVTPSGFPAKLRMAGTIVKWNARRWLGGNGDPEGFLKELMARGVPLFHGRAEPVAGVDELLWASAIPPLDPVAPLQWDLLAWSARRALPRIRARTLVVTGDLDRLGAPEARRLARAIPDASHHLIPGAGHTPFLDDPDAFRAVVLPFLQDAAGADDGRDRDG